MQRCRFSTLALAASLLPGCFAADRPGLPRPAADAPLNQLLDMAGERVSLFWRQVSGVTCIEDVRQVKLGAKQKVLAKQESRFDYLALLSLRGDRLSFEESRVLQSDPAKPSSLPLLVTNGFSTLAMVFHPIYQSNFEYEAAGKEEVNGVQAVRVHFRHIPGTPSTAVLRLRNRDFPLELQGDAWIEGQTGVVTRVHAGLAVSLEDLGVKRLESDVRYTPVPFTSGTVTATYWLPSEATVEVETVRQRWRNTHRFSDYRRFSIEATSSVQK